MERRESETGSSLNQRYLRPRPLLDKRVGRRWFLVAAFGGACAVGYEIEVRSSLLGRFFKHGQGNLSRSEGVVSEKSATYFLPARSGLETVEVELSELERDTFLAINRVRADQGLAGLELDDILTRVARIRNADMMLGQYFSHDSPDEFSFDDLLEDAGYFKGLAGENLARNNYPYDLTVDVAVRDWMQSPGHRQNILTKEYNRIGVGVSKVKGLFGFGEMYLFTNIFLAYPNTLRPGIWNRFD